MNEFNAVTTDGLKHVEGGFDLGLAVAGGAGFVLGGIAGAVVSTIAYEVVKSATSPNKN
jgi:ABC-type branched-subunit amino acid transport system permease subunit